jgi:hypothetical protein
LIFTKNAKKDSLKIQQVSLNSGTLTEHWQTESNKPNTSGRHGEEALESPTSSFQNSLSTIIPWKEKMVNLKSFINYQTDKQTLDITPASYLDIPGFKPDAISETVRQNFRLKTFEANHSANIGFLQKDGHLLRKLD